MIFLSFGFCVVFKKKECEKENKKIKKEKKKKEKIEIWLRGNLFGEMV